MTRVIFGTTEINSAYYRHHEIVGRLFGISRIVVLVCETPRTPTQMTFILAVADANLDVSCRQAEYRCDSDCLGQRNICPIAGLISREDTKAL